MIKRISVITVYLLLVLSLYSQVGYLGKRFIFNLDARVSPTLLSKNYQGKSSYLDYHLAFEPNIEFVLTKKTSIGLSYTHTKGDFPVRIYASGEIQLDNHYQGFYVNEEISGNKFTTDGIGLFYKLYTWGNSAPMGSYIKFQVDYLRYNYTLNEINLSSYLENPPASYSFIFYPKESGTNSVMGAKIEFGYDYLLFNYLRVSTGVSLGGTFRGFKMMFSENDIIYDFNDPDRAVVKPTDFIDAKIFSQYWIGLKMGIGIVAF